MSTSSDSSHLLQPGRDLASAREFLQQFEARLDETNARLPGRSKWLRHAAATEDDLTAA